MADGTGGRAHLHGVADEARRSIPAQCMGLLCMPAGKRGAVRACGEGSSGKLARCAQGIRHVAERSRFVQQARSRRALRRGQDGSTPVRAAPGLGDLRSADALNSRSSLISSFKASADLKSAKSLPRQYALRPPCPRHSARLLRACRTHLLRAPQPTVARGAHLASVPGSLHRMHMRTARRHAEQAHALGRDAPIRASSATP